VRKDFDHDAGPVATQQPAPKFPDFDGNTWRPGLQVACGEDVTVRLYVAAAEHLSCGALDEEPFDAGAAPRVCSLQLDPVPDNF
jgi:hypothetical protein